MLSTNWRDKVSNDIIRQKVDRKETTMEQLWGTLRIAAKPLQLAAWLRQSNMTICRSPLNIIFMVHLQLEGRCCLTPRQFSGQERDNYGHSLAQEVVTVQT